MVESTALEMRHTRKGIAGSNPALSARDTISPLFIPLQKSAEFLVLTRLFRLQAHPASFTRPLRHDPLLNPF